MPVILDGGWTLSLRARWISTSFARPIRSEEPAAYARRPPVLASRSARPSMTNHSALQFWVPGLFRRKTRLPSHHRQRNDALHVADRGIAWLDQSLTIRNRVG